MEFKKVKLGEIGKIVGGGTPKTKEESYYGGKIAWITPKDLSLNKSKYIFYGERNITEEGLKNSSAKLLPKGTVLFSSRAPIGYVAIAGNDLATNQGFKSVILAENVDSEFIYYLLINNVENIKNFGVGSTFREVSGSVMKNIEVMIPDFSIQRKIAKILNTLDSKIEINNKIISNLESQAQAIFKSWFVDFEPFQDGEFVESELGMIPEGWEVKKVNEICDLKIGRTPPRKESEWFSLKEGVKWVSIKDLGLSQMYISEVTEYLTEESIEKFNIPIVEENTLLLSFKLTVGRIAITTEKMCTNEAIAQFKDPLISTLFLFYYFKNFKFETLGNTSSIGNAVNSKIIKNIEVLVPPEKIVLKVMKMIEPLSICIRNLLNQNTKLAEMRDALLPKLMAGEIDVSNIKIEGEEVKNE